MEQDGRGVTREQLVQAMRADQMRAGRRGEFRTIQGGGRLHMQVSLAALMNAVDTEGRAVLSPDADGYWEDMKRLYPWTNTMPDKQAPRALRNRLGRVKERTVYLKNGERGILT